VLANGRACNQGQCKVCHSKKSCMAKGSGPRRGGGKRPVKGKGFFNDTVLPNLPELHYISPFSGKRYNFAGPGTRLDKRLDHNKQPLPHSIPVNDVDKSAYHHDLAYEKYSDINSRRFADNVMIDELSRIRKDSKNYGRNTRADAALVGLFMRGKRFLGLGKKRK